MSVFICVLDVGQLHWLSCSGGSGDTANSITVVEEGSFPINIEPEASGDEEVILDDGNEGGRRRLSDLLRTSLQSASKDAESEYVSVIVDGQDTVEELQKALHNVAELNTLRSHLLYVDLPSSFVRWKKDESLSKDISDIASEIGAVDSSSSRAVLLVNVLRTLQDQGMNMLGLGPDAVLIESNWSGSEQASASANVEQDREANETVSSKNESEERKNGEVDVVSVSGTTSSSVGSDINTPASEGETGLPAPTKSIGPMIVPPPGAPIQSDTPGSDGERPPFFMWIRSVSFRALREDVERLLESVTVRRMGPENGIYMMMGPRNRFNGECLVCLDSEEDLRRALLMDRTLMDDRIMLMSVASADEYRRILSQARYIRGSHLVMKIRGLPFEVTEKEIRDVFIGYAIDPGADSVHLCVGRRGFPNGDAFVRFANYQDFRRALYECNRREIQGRYIELFPSTSDEWELDKNEFPVNADGSAMTPIPSSSSSYPGPRRFPRDFRPLPYVVRLRGVPFSCSERDVIEFFRPLHIEFRDIYLCADTRGRFTGEVYVQFPSEYELREALRRHKSYLGTRYVEVFESSPAELEEEMARGHSLGRSRFERHGAGEYGSGSSYRAGSMSSGNNPYVWNASMSSSSSSSSSSVPPSSTNMMQPSYQQQYSQYMTPNASVSSATWGDPMSMGSYSSAAMNPSSLQPGSMYPAQYGYPSAGAGVYQMPGSTGMPQTTPSGYPPSATGAVDPSYSSYGSYGVYGNYSAAPQQPVAPTVPSPGSALKMAGATLVEMRGLPFTATERDIMEFFRGYNLAGVHILLDRTNRPSGRAEAWFWSADEARDAAHRMHRSQMGMRYIELFLT